MLVKGRSKGRTGDNVVMAVTIIAENERQVTEGRPIQNRGPSMCNH